MTLLAVLQWRPHLNPLLRGLPVLRTAAWIWFLYRRLRPRLPPPKARNLLLPKILFLI